MEYYINSVASSREQSDIKSLVPDANMRRRMSRILKMGVGTAMECLAAIPLNPIDAIITTTGLGCLSDSEKFLKSIIEHDERLLNPTPFIQSTFNTIGGQIAQITGNHCYNMTYSHREHSFESGLLDTLMLLEEGAAKNVLLGAIDEMTPTQVKIMERMGLYRGATKPAEGAHFFVISSEPAAFPLAIVEQISFEGSVRQCDAEIVVQRSYHTATAQAMYDGLKLFSDSISRVCIVNRNVNIVLKCM